MRLIDLGTDLMAGTGSRRHVGCSRGPRASHGGPTRRAA